MAVMPPLLAFSVFLRSDLLGLLALAPSHLGAQR